MSAAALAAPAPMRWSPWTHRPTECAAVGLWFWATATVFAGQTPILYALTAYFLVGCWIHWPQTRATFGRGWMLLLLPVWSIASTTWSAVPDTTARLGLQLLLSVVISAYAATRLNRRDVVVGVFFAMFYYALVSAPHLRGMDGGDLQGIFPEKNILASRMSMLTFAGATIFFDSGFPRWLRWAAVPVVGLAVILLAGTHSATAILTAGLGVMLILGFVMVWRPARGARALILATVATVALAGILYLAQKPHFSLSELVFTAFGKDSTLTGRTDLWAYAQTLIKAKPLLGVGSGAFWIPDRLDAQSLLDLFYKPRGTVFSFHDSYLELSVHLGLIGLALGVAGLAWTIWVMVRALTLELQIGGGFFLAVTLVAMMRSFVESDMWRQFELVQMIVWMGALMAARDLSLAQQAKNGTGAA
jgi:exopolysaccharide production protein ExoQ